MKRHIVTVGTAICMFGSVVACAQTKRALLIGIDLYQPAGTTASGCAYAAYAGDGRCALGTFPNLQGSVNDAQSMADVLTNPKYGFPAENVVLLTNPAPDPAKLRPGVVALPATKTNHDGILAAMQKYLVDLPHKGDTVVFYDASHGSLVVNTAGTKLTVRNSGGDTVHVDSTLVPSDAYKGVVDVRDKEMTRIFNAAVAKGVVLTVIFDSCHSGGSTRGIGGGRKRSLDYDPRPITDADVLPKPTEDKDNPALEFDAVQQDQTAGETDPDSPPIHGAFTAALVETLQILPADAPASLVYQRVKAVLEGQGTVGQEPDLGAGPVRRQQPLFGGKTNSADAAKVRTEALKTDDDGSIWLDIGMVSGIGPDSEFTTDPTAGKAIKLRVTEPLGIARSRAKVVSPIGAKVAVGEVFTLSKLVPSQTNPLRFWVGPTNLTTADLLAAVAEINASGIPTITDAAEEPYTDVLNWDGSAWILEHATPTVSDPSSTILVVDAKPAVSTKLGPKLSAASLKSAVTPGAKLWVDLPATRELAAKLTLTNPNSEAQSAATLSVAHYVLAGSLSNGNPTYTWFHKDEFAAGPHAVVSTDHTPGCSATSPYPVRSDWIETPDATTMAKTADTLNTFSIRLARVHGWLQLANNPVAGTSPANYYKLTMVHMTDTGQVSSDQPLHENDRIRLALQAAQPVSADNKRWVYVLDIDCQGTGTLLYPRNYAENQYPGDGDTDLQIILRHASTITFKKPFGLESMILLSTSQPLPDPYVLDFAGVARSVSRGGQSPLEQLLSNASSGMRGGTPDVDIPTDWGIQVMQLRSLPGAAAPQ